MHICYLDESGDTRALPVETTDPSMPKVFAFAGVSFNGRENNAINRDLVVAKLEYLGESSHAHDNGKALTPEVKGRALRHAIQSDDPAKAFQFLDRVLAICRQSDIRCQGRVFVKEPGKATDGDDHYNRAVQLVSSRFHERLDAIDHQGVVVVDNRNPAANEQVAHSIYVDKFRTETDRYPRIVDLPTFGQSQNHAGLQLADLVCELVVCLALANICGEDGARRLLADKYGDDVRELQGRYVDRPEKVLDGIVVATLGGQIIAPARLYGRG